MFKVLYGEPNWSHRPYNNSYGIDVMPAFDNASYEENRLRTYKFEASNIDFAKLSISENGSQGELSSAFSFSGRQKIYLKWFQSPHVDIFVGSEETPYKIPGDFLARRSSAFRVMIESQFLEAGTRTIRLPETESAVFDQVLLWLMSPCPSLHENLPIPVAVDIAIFATIYIIPALLNQTLDLLWEQIRTSACWTPSDIDRIYRQTHADSSLRRFVRACLLASDGPVPFENSDLKVEDWQPVFESHAALGYDYFAARHKISTMTRLIHEGQCRFHQHTKRALASQATNFNASTCKRLQEAECFEDADEVETRFSSQESLHDSEPAADPSSPLP